MKLRLIRKLSARQKRAPAASLLDSEYVQLLDPASGDSEEWVASCPPQ